MRFSSYFFLLAVGLAALFGAAEGCICTTEYEPVCSESTGKGYGNECLGGCAGDEGPFSVGFCGASAPLEVAVTRKILVIAQPWSEEYCNVAST